MAKKKKTDLFKIFAGEYVEFVGEFSGHAIDGRVTGVQGYMLDMDDDFYYVGVTPDEVSAVIKRDKIYTMQIIQAKNPLKEYLENYPTPEKDNAN